MDTRSWPTLDNLRLIDRGSGYPHQPLELGASREETRQADARTTVLRRVCAEEVRKQPLAGPALEGIDPSWSRWPQLGFDPKRSDHERAL